MPSQFPRHPPRPVRGMGVVRPTFVRELAAGREDLTLSGAVGLAMRVHRSERGLSQRDYAAWRGWSKSHQWRLESRAGELCLSALDAALEDTGYRLALVHVDPVTPRRRDEAELAEPEQFPVPEFVARDRAGRRFPAHLRVSRTRWPPRWWWDRYATTGRPPPEWTTAPRGWVGDG